MRKAYLINSREEYDSLTAELAEAGIKWEGGHKIENYNPYIHFPEYKETDQIVIYVAVDGIMASRYHFYFDINNNYDNEFELLNYGKLLAERK